MKYVFLFFFALLVLPAQAQDYMNQRELARIQDSQTADLDALPEVHYNYVVMWNESRIKNKLNLYAMIGKENRELVQLLNRDTLEDLNKGDTLVVPTRLDLDLRAYSPFPRYYPGGREFSKLFIIDKSTQAFAAYEHGRLTRWGIVNTGADGTATPNGRFNFNWKQPERVSTLSPPGEEWLMTWVFNFHEARGIHIHQYAMPTSGPASHGCVRLLDADAKFIYDWADTWKKKGGSEMFSQGVKNITQQGTTVLVIGGDPKGKPQPFAFKKHYPILKRVQLPAHPYDIEPGTPQQEYFDRLRAMGTK